MNTLCYSVRLENLYKISDKCYKAICFDGSEDLIPAKFVFGQDYEVQKSEAWWIAAWILKQKNIQYSSKKSAWFNENGKKLPKVSVEKHDPDKVAPVSDNEINELKA